VYVYRRKGVRLQEKRCTFTGEKVYVYRRKGVRLQEGLTVKVYFRRRVEIRVFCGLFYKIIVMNSRIL